MNVHLIKKETISDFVKKNARSKSSFELFLTVLKGVDWEKPSDILETFNSADILGKNSNRVIFNIGGNNFRIICQYAFGEKNVHLYICWIGPHAEYTQLCNKGEQYTVADY